jgi:hypothetical protein
MGTIRKAVSVFDEFDGWTYLKPFSDEYLKFLIVIHEDAYGEMTMKLTPIEDIEKNFSGSEEEFREILKQLGI